MEGLELKRGFGSIREVWGVLERLGELSPVQLYT